MKDTIKEIGSATHSVVVHSSGKNDGIPYDRHGASSLNSSKRAIDMDIIDRIKSMRSKSRENHGSVQNQIIGTL